MIEGLPEKLRMERAKVKCSQRQVAEATGITKASRSNYENGTINPPSDALMKLASYYHVSTDYLLGIDKHRSIDVAGLDNEEITSLELTRNIFLKLKSVK